jgi:hypothetical protein
MLQLLEILQYILRLRYYILQYLWQLSEMKILVCSTGTIFLKPGFGYDIPVHKTIEGHNEPGLQDEHLSECRHSAYL